MLTTKQKELLLFIHERIKEDGVSPSFDEMKEALNLASKSGIHRLIVALEERGFIRRLANRARALEVKGDSMIDAGILDGDIVILKRTDSANSGDIVVALIDDEEATLKRLRKKGESVALEAANPAYETSIFGPDRVRVQGRLVALIRKYE